MEKIIYKNDLIQKNNYNKINWLNFFEAHETRFVFLIYIYIYIYKSFKSI